MNKFIAFIFKEPKPWAYNVVFYTISLAFFAIGIYLGVKWYFALGLLFGGCLFWMIMEYVIHRYIFHFKSKNVTIKKIVYAIHGVHHKHPDDHDKLYVPIIPALMLLASVTFMLYVFLGGYAFSVLTGFLLMHQLYNYLHYAIHTNKFANNRYIKAIKRNHDLHHKISTKKNFGVTTVVFDKLFGSS